MTTEWTDLPTLQDVAAAQARGDEIHCFAAVWERWGGDWWDADAQFRSRPKQKTPEERIAELENLLGEMLADIKEFRAWNLDVAMEVALESLIGKIEARK